MTLVHIYRTHAQPAIRWTLDMGEGKPPLVMTNGANRLLWCEACGRRRRARDMVAHAYYDHTSYFCREKEYGRAPVFPFEYRHVCVGTALKVRRREYP